MTGALAAGAASPSPLWYATRATGVVALVLLTVTVVLGIAGTARVASPRWPRVITAGLHRNVALLVVAFVGVHILTTVLDSYAPIGWIAAVVPFTSAYRPLWLSLGTIAFDLLLALVITSLLRARLGYRGWRLVHWSAYLAWPVALWHGLGTGTDSRLPWLLALDAAAVAAVACAVWWRLSLPETAPRPLTMAIAVTAVPLVTIMFMLLGPLQPGWARRAGTPVRLLAGQSVVGGGSAGAAGSGSAGAASGSAAGQPSASLPSGGRFTGHASRRSGPGQGQVTITITATTSGTPAADLVVTLQGTPDGAGVFLQRGLVRIGPAGAATSYAGPVVALDGQQLVADLSSQSGSRAQARIRLEVVGGRATGRLTISRGGEE
jgi:methionine sulfoxide reductase heme-binding subunit